MVRGIGGVGGCKLKLCPSPPPHPPTVLLSPRLSLSSSLPLQTATAATALAARRVRRDRRDVLDPPDLDPRARERPQRRLRAGPGRLGLVAARRAQLDVQRGDAELLDARGDVLGREHGRVGARLVAVGLDLHAARHAAERLLAREVGDVDKGVVEGREDVGDADGAPLAGAVGEGLDRGLGLLDLDLLGGHGVETAFGGGRTNEKLWGGVFRGRERERDRERGKVGVSERVVGGFGPDLAARGSFFCAGLIP